MRLASFPCFLWISFLQLTSGLPQESNYGYRIGVSADAAEPMQFHHPHYYYDSLQEETEEVGYRLPRPSNDIPPSLDIDDLIREEVDAAVGYKYSRPTSTTEGYNYPKPTTTPSPKGYTYPRPGVEDQFSVDEVTTNREYPDAGIPEVGFEDPTTIRALNYESEEIQAAGGLEPEEPVFEAPVQKKKVKPHYDESDDVWPDGFKGVIPGEEGIDYPAYTDIPQTSFDCSHQEYSGYYADVETRCQAFHVCLNRAHRSTVEKWSFLCPNGTVFSQQDFVCVWWNMAPPCDSDTTQRLYSLNQALGWDNEPPLNINIKSVMSSLVEQQLQSIPINPQSLPTVSRRPRPPPSQPFTKVQPPNTNAKISSNAIPASFNGDPRTKAKLPASTIRTVNPPFSQQLIAFDVDTRLSEEARSKSKSQSALKKSKSEAYELKGFPQQGAAPLIVNRFRAPTTEAYTEYDEDTEVPTVVMMPIQQRFPDGTQALVEMPVVMMLPRRPNYDDSTESNEDNSSENLPDPNLAYLPPKTTTATTTTTTTEPPRTTSTPGPKYLPPETTTTTRRTTTTMAPTTTIQTTELPVEVVTEEEKSPEYDVEPETPPSVAPEMETEVVTEKPKNTYLPPKQVETEKPSGTYLPPKLANQEEKPSGTYLPPKLQQRPRMSAKMISAAYLPPKEEGKTSAKISALYLPPTEKPKLMSAKISSAYLPPKMEDKSRLMAAQSPMYLPPKLGAQVEMPKPTYLPPQDDPMTTEMKAEEEEQNSGSYLPPKPPQKPKMVYGPPTGEKPEKLNSIKQMNIARIKNLRLQNERELIRELLGNSGIEEDVEDGKEFTSFSTKSRGNEKESEKGGEGVTGGYEEGVTGGYEEGVTGGYSGNSNLGTKSQYYNANVRIQLEKKKNLGAKLEEIKPEYIDLPQSPTVKSTGVPGTESLQAFLSTQKNLDNKQTLEIFQFDKYAIFVPKESQKEGKPSQSYGPPQNNENQTQSAAQIQIPNKPSGLYGTPQKDFSPQMPNPPQQQQQQQQLKQQQHQQQQQQKVQRPNGNFALPSKEFSEAHRFSQQNGYNTHPQFDQIIFQEPLAQIFTPAPIVSQVYQGPQPFYNSPPIHNQQQVEQQGYPQPQPPVQQGYPQTQPPVQQGYPQPAQPPPPPVQQGYSQPPQPPVQQGYSQPPVQQGYSQPPAQQQGYEQPQHQQQQGYQQQQQAQPGYQAPQQTPEPGRQVLFQGREPSFTQFAAQPFEQQQNGYNGPQEQKQPDQNYGSPQPTQGYGQPQDQRPPGQYLPPQQPTPVPSQNYGQSQAQQPGPNYGAPQLTPGQGYGPSGPTQQPQPGYNSPQPQRPHDGPNFIQPIPVDPRPQIILPIPTVNSQTFAVSQPQQAFYGPPQIQNVQTTQPAIYHQPAQIQNFVPHVVRPHIPQIFPSPQPQQPAYQAPRQVPKNPHYQGAVQNFNNVNKQPQVHQNGYQPPQFNIQPQEYFDISNAKPSKPRNPQHQNNIPKSSYRPKGTSDVQIIQAIPVHQSTSSHQQQQGGYQNTNNGYQQPQQQKQQKPFVNNGGYQNEQFGNGGYQQNGIRAYGPPQNNHNQNNNHYNRPQAIRQMQFQPIQHQQPGNNYGPPRPTGGYQGPTNGPNNQIPFRQPNSPQNLELFTSEDAVRNNHGQRHKEAVSNFIRDQNVRGGTRGELEMGHEVFYPGKDNSLGVSLTYDSKA